MYRGFMIVPGDGGGVAVQVAALIFGPPGSVDLDQALLLIPATGAAPPARRAPADGGPH
jgi:hypothetical protein